MMTWPTSINNYHLENHEHILQAAEYELSKSDKIDSGRMFEETFDFTGVLTESLRVSLMVVGENEITKTGWDRVVVVVVK